MLVIFDSLLAGDFPFKEVTSIHLNTWLVGIHLHLNARQWRIEACSKLLVIALTVAVGFQTPVVVETIGVLDGLHLEIVHVLTNFRWLSETHRRVLNPCLFTCCHVGGICRSIIVGIHVEDAILDVYRRVAVQVKIRVISHIDERRLIRLC